MEQFHNVLIKKISGQCFITRAEIKGFWIGLNRFGDGQQFTAQRERLFPHRVGEQAVVPDALKSAGKRVKQKSAQKLPGGKGS